MFSLCLKYSYIYIIVLINSKNNIMYSVSPNAIQSALYKSCYFVSPVITDKVKNAKNVLFLTYGFLGLVIMYLVFEFIVIAVIKCYIY